MMSTGNATSDRLDEVLDAAAAESDASKLDDAEIQRLVALSRDASYRRTERVPVKSIEAFEPRSLVSIAMAAQRRREEEMRFDAAAAAATAADQDASSDALAADGDQSADAAAADMAATGLDADGPLVDGDMPPAPSAGGEDMPAADGDSAVGDAQIDEGQAGAASADAAPTDEAQLGDAPSAATAPNIDFEAGHASGLEEGRKVGFDEGHAKGMDERDVLPAGPRLQPIWSAPFRRSKLPRQSWASLQRLTAARCRRASMMWSCHWQASAPAMRSRRFPTPLQRASKSWSAPSARCRVRLSSG